MSKKVSLIVMLVVIALLVGIVTWTIIAKLENGEIKLSRAYFKGVVVNAYGTGAIVKVEEGESIRRSGDLVSISAKGENLQIGDYVQVTYDGDVMESYPLQVKTLEVKILNSDKVASMYTTILEHIWKEDNALNHEAKFISIDFSKFLRPWDESEKKENETFPAIKERTKQIIIEYAQRYHETIKTESFEQLKAQGFFHEDTMSLEGVLIYITDIEELTENKAVISVTKYRSGLGAIFPKYELNYKDGKWEIKVLEMAIS